MNGEARQGTLEQQPEPTRVLRREVVVANPQGLHLRPAAAFAKLARQFASAVTVVRDDRSVNGKSQLDLLMLAAESGTRLIVEVAGSDAEEALGPLADVLGLPNCDEVE
jgi:phosphotransferase system HPr (HPr) family protein